MCGECRLQSGCRQRQLYGVKSQPLSAAGRRGKSTIAMAARPLLPTSNMVASDAGDSFHLAGGSIETLPTRGKLAISALVIGG
jgi:hypothetical protein